jgi:hypothetical protein
MRHLKPLMAGAIVASSLLAASSAQAAVGNDYFRSDGGDPAVRSAAPQDFRLNHRYLEPGCYELGRMIADGLVDVGDHNEELQVRVADIAKFSVDQVLVAGEHSGYRVYNTFDTGTSSNDADIDPNQTGTDMQTYRGAGDDVDEADTIVCVSDHEDSGQNEPYAQEAGGEVSAKNRPVIQPTIAALGVSAIGPLNTYRVGFGYSIQSWYAEYRIADLPPYVLNWTDPLGAGNNPNGSNTPSHLLIKHRIAGPVFDASSTGPGVMRVNDIDVAGEDFADPHFERSDYGQTEVFHAAGDPKSWCLGDHCTPAPGGSRLLTFTTQGDLPISWSLKAGLATPTKLRTITLSAAFLDSWHEAWANWCAHQGPKPTLPLAPGTNAPCTRGAAPAPAPTASPQPSPAPVAPATNTVIERTVIQQVQAPAPLMTPSDTKSAKKKKGATKAQKAKHAKCVKAANKKKGKKARSRARAKCARMPH